MTTMQTKDNTPETDVPAGQGFRYPSQVFTDPMYAVAICHMKEEGEVEQEINSWAGIVSFVISVAKHIAGVSLLIVKKEC